MGGRGGAPMRAQSNVPAARSPAEAEILAIYGRLRQPGDWLGLADIRDAMEKKGYSRQQQDAAFRSLLAHEPNVRMVPNANVKAASTRDLAAAFVRDATKFDDNPSTRMMAFNVDPAYTFEKRPRR